MKPANWRHAAAIFCAVCAASFAAAAVTPAEDFAGAAPPAELNLDAPSLLTTLEDSVADLIEGKADPFFIEDDD